MPLEQERSGHPPGGGGEHTHREGWKERTKAIERVLDVAMTLRQPQTADWIADEALVSTQTARDHLEMLATELGVIRKVTTSGVTKYQPDPAYLRYRELSEVVARVEDEDELLDRIEEYKSEIETIQSKYSVDVPAALRLKAATDETTAEEVAEFKQVASEWETLEHRLEIFSEAIQRYDQLAEPADFQ